MKTYYRIVVKTISLIDRVYNLKCVSFLVVQFLNLSSKYIYVWIKGYINGDMYVQWIPWTDRAENDNIIRTEQFYCGWNSLLSVNNNNIKKKKTTTPTTFSRDTTHTNRVWWVIVVVFRLLGTRLYTLALHKVGTDTNYTYIIYIDMHKGHNNIFCC